MITTFKEIKVGEFFNVSWTNNVLEKVSLTEAQEAIIDQSKVVGFKKLTIKPEEKVGLIL